MQKVLFKIGIIFLLIFSSLTSVSAHSQVDSLKIGITKDENGLNPYTYITGYPGLDLVSLLYDNLFVLDKDNQPKPWLVKDYQVSEDGLTYNFTLNENIKWQDGQPLTAEDVKFTMEYFLENPKSRFTNPLKTITSINLENEKSFQLVLSKPEPNFMIQPLADLPILPKHIWSKVTKPDDETNALGSGPYSLVEHKSGQYYKMQANKDYFKGAPPVKELIFPIIEDTTALFNALQAGEIDAISSSISPELVNQFEENPGLKVVRGPGYNSTLFQFNAEKYPMTEKSFRNAIDYAIDKQYIVDTLLLGFAQVGSPGFIHSTSPFYNPNVKPVFDLEKSKELLDEAGFMDVDGDGIREDQKGNKIDLTILVYSSNPIRIRTAEYISESLNKVGIGNSVKAMDDTTVDSLMWPDFDVSKGRDFDLGIWGWSNSMQQFPERIVDLFHSDPAVGTVNIGGYKNADFDALAEKLKGQSSDAERLETIKEMQAFIGEESPIITLYFQEIVNAYNPEKYDGYVFQVGKGIINKLSFTSGDKEEVVSADHKENSDDKSVNEEPNSENKESNNTVYILGGLIVLVLVAFSIIKKKSKTKKKDDINF